MIGALRVKIVFLQVKKELTEHSGYVKKGSKESKVKVEGAKKKRERFNSGEVKPKVVHKKRHRSAEDVQKKRERFNSGDTGKQKKERNPHSSGDEEKVKGKRKQTRILSPDRKAEQKPKEIPIGERSMSHLL